jgi:hypothetical protein
MQFQFRSHFSGKKVHLTGWEIQYLPLNSEPHSRILECGCYPFTYLGKVKILWGNITSRIINRLHQHYYSHIPAIQYTIISKKFWLVNINSKFVKHKFLAAMTTLKNP